MRIQRLAVLACALAVAGCSSDKSVGRTPLAIGAGGDGAAMTAKSGAPAAPGGAVALTEDMARPYWTSGVAGDAFAKMQLEDWKAARAGFQAYLTGDGAPTDEAERARVTLLIARCNAELGAWKDAARGFDEAAAKLPLIGDYIRYEAARAYYFAHDMNKAMERARAVAADSIRGADAELLIGDLLRARKDHDAIALHYQKYLADRPEGIRVEEAYYRLGEALEAAGGADEAAVAYRALTVKAPVSSWGTKAQARLDAILPTLSEARRTELTTFNATEQLERATALYDAMRNPESAAAFEAALNAPGITAAQRCQATYYQADSWFKERNRGKAAPLFDDAMKLCTAAGDVDLQVKAGYQAGRSYRMIGKHEEAAERYARTEKLAAANDHTYADDARLRQAEEWAQVAGAKPAAKVTELLSNLPDLYPDGDMRAEAMWRLAWRAYLDKDYAQAVKWLNKQIATKPIEDKYYAEGQPQYWLGRTYAKLGKTDESIAAYEDAVRKYPLTYYALLALNRLREDHPDRFAALVAEIKAAPADYDPAKPDFQFHPRAIYGEPGFQRAIELLRLGVGWAAEWELAKLGLTAPDGKSEVTDPDQREMLWAMAFLQHNAGRYEPSHWVTRWHVLDYKRAWPVGTNQARWVIGYPKAFWSLIEKYATQHGYPMALQMSIMREESAFDPLRESWANAIGLTQMIYPTAVRFGKGTGIEINRDNLRDPEKNVIIGSNFLVFLWNKWDKHTALVPPSYNAGENAVARWLRERGTMAVDEFAEAIVGDQARNYSKRVLASYFVYSYLYGGDIPVMRNDIPKDIIPAARKPAKKSSKKAKKGQTNYED